LHVLEKAFLKRKIWACVQLVPAFRSNAIATLQNLRGKNCITAAIGAKFETVLRQIKGCLFTSTIIKIIRFFNNGSVFLFYI